MNAKFISTAVATGLLVMACGSSGGTPAPATQKPATNPPSTTTTTNNPPASGVPTGISGNVDIHGSSTVYPISNAVAEDIQGANPDFSFVVGDEGTGSGFKDFFCVGQSDISDASRKIKPDDPTVAGDEEATVCAANNINYAELKVGYDGLSVITSPNNPINCLTFADLYALMGPEADNVANWNDAEALAHQLGSTTDLPDAPLSITAPGDESGTYDSFIELVMAKFIAAQFPNDPATTANETADATHLRAPGAVYVASANDNAIIQGVAGFDTSLGFVGLAYAEENASSVKVLGVDKGDGNCVAASKATVLDGTYPISRALYIYPNLGKAATNPTIGQYVDYYLSDAGITNVGDVGYVSMSADELTASRNTWNAAKP